MTGIGSVQITLCCPIVVALVKPLGGGFAGARTFLSPILGPIECNLYRLAGVGARVEGGLRALAFGARI
jgi:K+-transporting ATPase ATPase A chain